MPASPKQVPFPIAFRWSYIAVPLAITGISVLAAIVSYPALPDSVAYHFRFDGSPDRWLGRNTIIALTLVPQFIFTGIAATIPMGIIRILSLRPSSGVSVKVERMLTLMGNMIALPQSVLCFAMLDIVGYNSIGVHLIPLWVFTIIAMVIGIVAVGWFFKSALKSPRP